MFSGIDRHHLEGGDGIEPLLEGVAHHHRLELHVERGLRDDQPIRSVFCEIVGVLERLPGTTHLVNLIAADERLRSMPLWEGQEPVPDPAEKPGPDGIDPRCDAGSAGPGWGK